MVLVDRFVGFVDELQEIIKETQPLDRSVADALERLPVCGDEIRRYHALKVLRERKASRASAVRQEPLPSSIDVPLYRELLDGIEPCFSQVAAPPSVTLLSLKISWPPNHLLSGYHTTAFISSCHRCFLVLYVGSYRPGFLEPGFYLVYNALANSVSLVPPLYCVGGESHCDIGAGVAVLSCGKEHGDEYVLAELLLRKDAHSHLPTNDATLFIWESSSALWVQREVVLPLPVATGERPFRADMVFAVSSSSLCWVDLLTGILVYNHIDTQEFHFIPLPEESAMDTAIRMQGRRPEEYRSMCCIDDQTLKFVSINGFEQYCPISDLILTAWTLRRPLDARNWKWEKDVMSSFRIQDIWNDPVYKMMNLPPVMPSYPVISMQQPRMIYLSVTDYRYNHSHEGLEAGESYVISLNVDRCRVESAYRVPCDENEIIPHTRMFTSEFSSYLNKVIPNRSLPLLLSTVVVRQIS